MIKKKLFKFCSVFICATMMACSLAACNTTNTANTIQEATKVSQASANTSNGTSTIIQNAIDSQLLTSGSAVTKTSTSNKNNSKEETVYVFADANGKQDHVLVNENLRNTTALPSISDVSTLKNIQNLSGDETSTTGANNLLTWAADGNNITYQGTSSQQAPVTMKVTYMLDGKEISADNLAGKSGKVTMRFDYTNNEQRTITVNGKSKTVYVPFTMITGMLLPSDTFSNIEVTNGKVLEYSDGNVAMGVTMPGLKNSLNLTFDGKTQDLDVPEYFEVTADVKDFKLDMTMSVATSNTFSDVNLDNLNLDDVKSQVNQLQDAANQLTDGTGTLQSGIATLADNVPALESGVATLDNAASSLVDGTAQLASGATQVQSGADQYTNGVASAADGSVKLAFGASQVSAGINALSDKFKDQIVSGVADLSSGASQVSAGIDKLVANLNTSFGQIKTNADTYGNAYTSTITQAGQVETLTNAPISAAGGATVNQMLGQISKAAGNIDLQANPKTDLTGSDLTKEATVTSLLTKYMTAYTTVVTMKAQGSTAFANIDAILNAASSGSITSINQVYQSEIGLLLSAVSKGGVYTALSQVYSTAMNTVDPDTGMNLTQSLSALSAGAKKVSDGAGTLKAGIGSFDDLQPQTETVCSALYKLKIGSLAVATGTSSLNDGLSKLNSNSEALNQGIAQLADGSTALAGGSAQIKDGTSQLNSAAVTLGDGVSALNEGAITLKDGMVEFNDTGIKKITSLLGNDTDDALDTIKQIVQLGNEYQSFAGKSDDVSGTVKFIYKTEGINQD